MIARLIGVQGWVGLAGAALLVALLLIEKSETRHWKKQSGQFEQLYRSERSALAATVANYRAAAAAARAADRAAAERVAAEQRAISERISNDYEARLAAARVAADRLRSQAGTAGADSRRGAAASVPGLPAAAGLADAPSGQDGLPDSDRLIATEQAIQLDELIKWVRRQSEVKREP